jgi:hypothetical protein
MDVGTVIQTFSTVAQCLKTLDEWVQTHRHIADSAKVSATISEAYAKLIDAQSTVLASQQEQLTLTKRIGELEKEIAELKNWDRERERYQLTTITRGILAYRVKPGMEGDEPSHDLCTNCFDQGKKSILQCEQPISIGPRFYICPRCKTSLGRDT